MNRIFFAAMLLGTIGAGVAVAQTTVHAAATTGAVATAAPTMPSAVTTDATNTNPAAPVAGANSFTMAQAQKRLEDNGYTQVSALTKDASSIWRGQATKDGKTMDVALDYQGNITAN